MFLLYVNFCVPLQLCYFLHDYDYYIFELILSVLQFDHQSALLQSKKIDPKNQKNQIFNVLTVLRRSA